MIRRILTLTVIGSCLALTGCTLYKADPKLAPQLSQITYPAESPLGEDLDIVVQKKGQALLLLNRTVHSHENVQVWLNQQYVGLVIEIPVSANGQPSKHPLNTFINEHSEPFPIGGLLTPDKGYPLVLTEIYDPATGQRHRLTTWRGKK